MGHQIKVDEMGRACGNWWERWEIHTKFWKTWSEENTWLS